MAEVRALIEELGVGLVLFGAYDGYDIVSFDDQVGAHGSTGGDQTYPFLIAPRTLDVPMSSASTSGRASATRPSSVRTARCDL